ncbi:MAG: hypothetical protein ABI559_11985 [Chloroflexota bacterium]
MTSSSGDGTKAGRAWEGFSTGARGSQGVFRIAVAAGVVAATAIVLTVAVVLTGGGGPSSAAPGIVAGVAQTPIRTISATGTPEVTFTPTPAPTTSPTAEPTPNATTATTTPTVDGVWTATPDAGTPTPTTVLTDPVGSLVSSIESTYGVRVLTDNQNWGDDQASQLRNLGAVSAALASIPGSVRSTNNANAGGTLTFLSNDGGSTEAGWQPYGSRAANYFSNEDMIGGSEVSANQVVLQPGSTAQTIAHEMMHAYQMRGQGAGNYAASLLTPEMKSFIQATGWTQLVSDDEVRADAASWDDINADFSYNGRSLSYTNEWGDTSTLYTPNPLEAYAETGGLYYGHSSAMTLPDWSDYWGWFSGNLG